MGLPSPLSKPLYILSIAEWSQKVEAGPSLYFSFRQSAETIQSAWNVIWLKRAERMEGQKQLNTNCFSFHRPPENRGHAGREVLWILHSVPFFEVWTMDNFNCSYMMVSWGHGTCLDLGESWDFLCYTIEWWLRFQDRWAKCPFCDHFHLSLDSPYLLCLSHLTLIPSEPKLRSSSTTAVLCQAFRSAGRLEITFPWYYLLFMYMEVTLCFFIFHCVFASLLVNCGMKYKNPNYFYRVYLR